MLLLRVLLSQHLIDGVNNAVRRLNVRLHDARRADHQRHALLIAFANADLFGLSRPGFVQFRDQLFRLLIQELLRFHLDDLDAGGVILGNEHHDELIVRSNVGRKLALLLLLTQLSALLALLNLTRRLSLPNGSLPLTVELRLAGLPRLSADGPHLKRAAFERIDLALARKFGRGQFALNHVALEKLPELSLVLTKLIQLILRYLIDGLVGRGKEREGAALSQRFLQLCRANQLEQLRKVTLFSERIDNVSLLLLLILLLPPLLLLLRKAGSDEHQERERAYSQRAFPCR